MDYLYNKNYLPSSIKFFDVFTGNDILITGDRLVFKIDISVVVDAELVADIPVVVDVVIEVFVAVVVNILLDILVIVVLLVLAVVSTFFIKIKMI